MLRGILVCVLAGLLGGLGWGATYKVTTKANSGSGSLRWAINKANNHPGEDRILFDPSLSGQVIKPTTPLPAITGPETIINGDIDGDGAPDIALNGANAGWASGLRIEANGCTVAGLAVAKFAGHGIALRDVTGCAIRRCHVGVDLAGTKAVRNRWHQIYLFSSDGNTIGGTNVAGRNIIAAGSPASLRSGVYLNQSSHNHIRNNNIGIGRDGTTPLTGPYDSGVGITLDGLVRVILTGSDGETPAAESPTRLNTIGGTPAERNVFGGMKVGLELRAAGRTWIRSNYFGLARNGNTPVPIGNCGIRVRNGSQENWIMGLPAAPETRNVICGGSVGVLFKDANTRQNYLSRNYFGLNAAGTRQRLLRTGVVCQDDAGRQLITSNTFGARRTSKQGVAGVSLKHAGAGSYMAHNKFGMFSRWGAEPATPADVGVTLDGVDAHLVFNDFRNTKMGVLCIETPAPCLIVRNKFRNCEVAAKLVGNSRPNLGNLDNATNQDDGGNQFYPSNAWYVRNESPNFIRAEGNRFPPRGAVGLKIWDKDDDGSLGRVDIYPLGEALAGSSAEGTLAVSGTAAIPTTGGAEIVFTLSAAADVSVTAVNIAGRPVRSICEARDCEAGVNSLVWNGQGSNGLPLPNGRYLIRVAARDGRGQLVTALAALRLQR